MSRTYYATLTVDGNGDAVIAQGTNTIGKLEIVREGDISVMKELANFVKRMVIRSSEPLGSLPAETRTMLFITLQQISRQIMSVCGSTDEVPVECKIHIAINGIKIAFHIHDVDSIR